MTIVFARVPGAQPDCNWLENKKVHGGQGRNRTTDTRIFSPPHFASSVTQEHPIEALSLISLLR